MTPSGSAYLFTAGEDKVGVGDGHGNWGNPGTLLAAHPNPFRSKTSISFALEEPGFARVTVLDIRGRRIRTVLEGAYPAGSRSVEWDGSTDQGTRVPSGVYFVRVETRELSRIRKVVFTR